MRGNRHTGRNELRKLGEFVSTSSVRSIWLRRDLTNFKGRLKALEAKVANDGENATRATSVPGYRRFPNGQDDFGYALIQRFNLLEQVLVFNRSECGVVEVFQ